MLGPPKTRHLDRSVLVSLDQLVPADHFYRHLERTLDLSFVRDWVKDCYAASGQPSIDPVVFFKLQLALFFEGLRSERQLMRVASDHLSIRWYAGYNLDEPLPDHSSLTRIRQRLGLAIFRRLFEAVVERCQQDGLIWGKELLVDATKVQGNASSDSMVPRLKEVVDDHLIQLFDDQGTDEAQQAQHETPPPLLHPPSATGARDPTTIEDRMKGRVRVVVPVGDGRQSVGDIAGPMHARRGSGPDHRVGELGQIPPEVVAVICFLVCSSERLGEPVQGVVRVAARARGRKGGRPKRLTLTGRSRWPGSSMQNPANSIADICKTLAVSMPRSLAISVLSEKTAFLSTMVEVGIRDGTRGMEPVL